MVYETADHMSAVFLCYFSFSGGKRVFKNFMLCYNNMTMHMREAMA